MDPIAGLGLGFQLALTPQNLLFALIGCLIGTAIGVLPGIGPVSGVAILLPVIFTTQMDSISGMIMLAAVYYGSQYGGSTTSILINTPGESSSLMAAFGLALGTVGIDSMTGVPRFTFGHPQLLNGFEFAVVAIGLFALAELFANAEESLKREVFETRLGQLWPTA